MVNPATTIDVFSLSMAGGHPVNEDAFVVEQASDRHTWICALADGQGGRSGGAVASKVACEAIKDLAQLGYANRLMETRAWEAMFRKSDEVVAAFGEAGFTTLIGFCVKDDKICGGSNGDSAVAVFDANRECYALTGNQIKNPPIGSGDASFVLFAADLNPPWMILVMSDGVWKFSRWEKIKEAGKTLRGQDLIDDLLQSARLTRSGQLQDDFTLVVLQSQDR